MRNDPADFGDLIAEAEALTGTEFEAFFARLPASVQRRMREEFFWQAHKGQVEPAACADGSEWRVWLLMAGRGFGKTRAGAEWVHARAREVPGARIALVGASRDDVAKVMVEGPSGLLSVARTGETPSWHPTQGVVRFASGARAFVYSAAAPGKLRGPEHHFGWADELAKWRRADAVWDILQMGLRLGARPRMMVTTTPAPVAIVRRIRAARGTAETRGRMADNVHVSEAFRTWAAETYGGTRLGRQELDGELFEDVAGALFPRALIERARDLEAIERAFLKRVVVGVDPPASVEGGCGIVVCALGADERLYVLDDRSVTGLRPEGWARAVARAAESWDADRVVAEKNQGGDMVESVLRGVEPGLPVRLVSASRGKAARAEPVAARFEAGRARLGGRFPALEDELAGLVAGGGYEGPGRSPDRADAMVWAMSALMQPAAAPRVLAL